MSEERCSKCGVVLVKDVNWLPGRYAAKKPSHLCRTCDAARARKYYQNHKKERRLYGATRRGYQAEAYVTLWQEEENRGYPVCKVCGVKLERGVNWYTSWKTQRWCIVCARKRTQEYDRRRGHLPMKADRSLLNDYYCYALIDSVGSTYYIGMGRGDRVNTHLRETQSKLAGKRKGKRGMLLYTEKEKRIIRCLDSPEGYRYVKLVTGLTQAQAFDAEAFWIEVYGQENLTNIAKPRSRGKPPIPAFQPKEIPTQV